jgi:hypothetical protein
MLINVTQFNNLGNSLCHKCNSHIESMHFPEFQFSVRNGTWTPEIQGFTDVRGVLHVVHMGHVIRL